MARVSSALLLTACIAVAAIGLGAAQRNTKAEVEKLLKEAKDLPLAFQTQWKELRERQNKNYLAEKASVKSKQSQKTKAAVVEAIAELDKVGQKILTNFLVFLKTQQTDTESVAAEYSKLLTERLTSRSVDEASIHKARQHQQEVFAKWVRLYGALRADAQNAFQRRVHELARSISAKASNPQKANAIRVAIEDAGVRLFLKIVGFGNKDVLLLTSRQNQQLNDFAQHAETVLIKLLVAAKQLRH